MNFLIFQPLFQKVENIRLEDVVRDKELPQFLHHFLFFVLVVSFVGSVLTGDPTEVSHSYVNDLFFWQSTAHSQPKDAASR